MKITDSDRPSIAPSLQSGASQREQGPTPGPPYPGQIPAASLPPAPHTLPQAAARPPCTEAQQERQPDPRSLSSLGLLPGSEVLLAVRSRRLQSRSSPSGWRAFVV